MLFYKLQESALQTVQKYNLSLIESGMGAQFTYTKITDKISDTTGICLTPKTEGINGGLEGDSLIDTLKQGSAFDAGKRAFGLSAMNAISQYLLKKRSLNFKKI